MQAAVSSVKRGSNAKPSRAKKSWLRATSVTGTLTNNMRPGCVGVVMVAKTDPGARTHRSSRPASHAGGRPGVPSGRLGLDELQEVRVDRRGLGRRHAVREA